MSSFLSSWLSCNNKKTPKKRKLSDDISLEDDDDIELIEDTISHRNKRRKIRHNTSNSTPLSPKSLPITSKNIKKSQKRKKFELLCAGADPTSQEIKKYISFCTTGGEFLSCKCGAKPWTKKTTRNSVVKDHLGEPTHKNCKYPFIDTQKIDFKLI